MKGGGSSVVPLTAGARTDIEKLLEKFLEKATVRYSHFLSCFQDMKFSTIYCGRPNETLREFEEKVLMMALSYCYPPYSYQTKIGGLYLIYALYYLQPNGHGMKIRITIPMMRDLMSLFDQLKKDAHLDGCYVFTRLLTENAFDVCKFQDEHNPLTYRRYDTNDDTEKTTKNLRNSQSAMEELLNDNLFEQVDSVHQQYSRMKNALFSNGEELPETLDLIRTSITDYMKSAIGDCEDKLERRFGRKRKSTETGEGSPTKTKRNVKDRRMEIRERAYGTLSTQSRLQRKKSPKGKKDDMDD